jgi:hypothetical protein
MNKLKKYNDFLILERYDKNIKTQLIKMGVTDKEESEEQLMSKFQEIRVYSKVLIGWVFLNGARVLNQLFELH